MIDSKNLPVTAAAAAAAAVQASTTRQRQGLLQFPSSSECQLN
jgi:hypothetical protein